MLDVLTERPPGVAVLFQSGEPFQPFERPLPEVVETSLFDSFEDLLSETQVRGGRDDDLGGASASAHASTPTGLPPQEFSADGPNTYVPSGRQFVISIEDGRVSGVLGNVFDAKAQEFAEFSPSSDWANSKDMVRQPSSATNAMKCHKSQREILEISACAHQKRA